MSGINQEIEHIFQLLCDSASNLKYLNKQYGSFSMEEYIQTISKPIKTKGLFQNNSKDSRLKESFYSACRNYVSPIIGIDKVDEMLRAFDTLIISTSNHMNVDTVGAYLQGNILFGYMMRELQSEYSIIPLLAAATVPLCNSTFPKGMVFRNQSGELNKLPLFRSKYDNCFVTNAPALCPENIDEVEIKIEKLRNCYLHDTLLSVLDKYYRSEKLFSKGTYMQQITWLNYEMSRDFVHGDDMRFVYIPMEKIASDMIVEQISDVNSPIYIMLFEPTVRSSILKIISRDVRLPRTDYFWGVSERKHKICLKCKGEKGYFGIHSSEIVENDLYIYNNPQAITEGILSGKLIPTAYFSIMLFMLSGVMRKTIGGFFCIDYFQTLKQALFSFFKLSYGSIPTYIIEQEVIYLCGPSVIGVDINKAVYSAGLFELLHAGGITRQQLHNMLKISWKDSHLLSLYELIYDILPDMRVQSIQNAKKLLNVIDDSNLLYRI